MLSISILNYETSNVMFFLFFFLSIVVWVISFFCFCFSPKCLSWMSACSLKLSKFLGFGRATVHVHAFWNAKLQYDQNEFYFPNNGVVYVLPLFYIDGQSSQHCWRRIYIVNAMDQLPWFGGCSKACVNWVTQPPFFQTISTLFRIDCVNSFFWIAMISNSPARTNCN